MPTVICLKVCAYGSAFQQSDTCLSAFRYNGDAVTSDERGFLFQYNLLIGGILIVQERGLKKPCDGMYSLFYPTCYTTDLVTADPPMVKNGTADVADLQDPTYLEVRLFGSSCARVTQQWREGFDIGGCQCIYIFFFGSDACDDGDGLADGKDSPLHEKSCPF